MEKRSFLLHFLACCLLLGAVLATWANGGPIRKYSAMTLSPQPVSLYVPEIQLVDECVSFTPNDRYMDVVARYLLHNHSDRSFDNLPYGFPIDYFGSGLVRWDCMNDYSPARQELGWRDGYIRNVSFMLGDRQLAWLCSQDTIIVPKSSDTHEISRRWFYTYLTIPAQHFVTLEVRYTVECTRVGDVNGVMNNLIEPYWGSLDFQYDFTPAAYWGDGCADHFSIVLDTSKIKITNDELFASAEKNIYGLLMKQDGQYWRYECNHFSLSKAAPFNLSFYYKNDELIHQPLDKILNHRISPSEYSIEVSGVNAGYPVTNLSDANPSTAAMLLPDKNDSIYITIRFHQPTVLEGMLLLNGYTRSEENYRNYARIDSLIITGQCFYVTTSTNNEGVRKTANNSVKMLFGRELFDARNKSLLPRPNKYAGHNPAGFDWQSLFDSAMILKLSDAITDRDDYYSGHYYSEIRIVITATSPGFKYKDLCLSEIVFVGR